MYKNMKSILKNIALASLVFSFSSFKALKAEEDESPVNFTAQGDKGSTAIKLSDSFSLPIFAQAIWNPRVEDAHLVFGISLRP